MSGNTPAGWYPDPERPGQQRYWDGTQWTDNHAPVVGAPQTQQPPQYRPGLHGWKALVVGGLVLALLVSCGVAIFGSSGDSGDSTSSTVMEPAPAEDPDSRCTKVPKSVLKELGDGLPLTDGWAVRSDDYTKVWFVAARYVNSWPVFSVNGDPSSPDTAFDGLVLSVNDDANETTPWPYGPDTPAKVSMSDDGAREAELCSLEAD